MKKTVFVVGMGGIGRHLGIRLMKSGIRYLHTDGGRKAGIPFEKIMLGEKPNAVFLAISTKDAGKAARDYILTCVKNAVPVITCEKGALAYYADTLRPYLHLIGYSATVGGGTQMLRYLQGRRLHAGPVEIQAVINGTLNYLFDAIGRGRSLDEAYQEARSLGYAEPGATDPLSLINGELQDIVLKTCVLLNIGINIEIPISPASIMIRPLTEDDFQKYASVGGEYRFVVSISNINVPTLGYESSIFTINNWNGWYVRSGFKQITASQDWLPNGVGNAIHITEGKLGAGGIYTLSGPGAGKEPTTSAMLADFDRLCK